MKRYIKIFTSKAQERDRSIKLSSDKTTIDYPPRQIHLDFHTSEHVEGIGERFNKQKFQQALQIAHVNLINVFAKGWHGWSYYDTQIGHRHPHLNFDLLKEQIEACHQIGVQACIYYAVGHAETDAERKPEWRLITKKGEVGACGKLTKTQPNDPRPDGTWTYMAPIEDYLNHMLGQIEEICKKYKLDGFWFDGVYTHPVAYNPELLSEMKAIGLDPNDDEAVFLYGVQKWADFMEKAKEIIIRSHPDASVFFNGTTEINNEKKNHELKTYQVNTKFDLEDLPTTSWGWYDKFPTRSKLFHNYDKPLVAMSGKFHEGWGEFGGFKHPDAIMYEAASMIAYGAACNFGDQLHPSGEIDMETYKIIAPAYEYVEKIEAFGVGGKPIANLGVWYANKVASFEGVANMLLETQVDFEVIEPDKGLDRYETIIIPSDASLKDQDVAMITHFLKSGGKMLVIGEGALNKEKNQFLLPVGAEYVGPAEKDVDYTLVKEELQKNTVKSPFLNNNASLRTKVIPGSKVLAEVYEPYFSRTVEKYFSHRNTPPKTEPAQHPAIVKSGNVIYFAHNLDQVYFEFGARLHRDVFSNALEMIHQPMLKVDMPSAARVSLLHQPEYNRYVAHLLYAIPIKRGSVHVIEDIVPLYNIPLSVQLPKEIKRAYSVPDMKSIKIRKKGKSYEVTIEKMKMHRAIVFEY